MRDEARRTYQIYLYAVCFAMLVIMVFAAAESLYGLFRLAAPKATNAGTEAGFFSDQAPEALQKRLEEDERKEGTADFVRWGLVAAAAFGVFRFHWPKAQAIRDEHAPVPWPVSGGGDPETATETLIALPPAEPVAPEESPFAPPDIVFAPDASDTQEAATPKRRSGRARKTVAAATVKTTARRKR